MKKNLIYFCGLLGLFCGAALASGNGSLKKVLEGKERRYFSLGQTELAKQFLDMSPDHVELCDEHGWTPLTVAAVAGHQPVVDDLVQRGANTYHRDGKGTPLLAHVVTNPHNLSIVQTLIRHTPHFAKLEQQSEVARVLKERCTNGAHEGYEGIDEETTLNWVFAFQWHYLVRKNK